MRYRYFKE